MPYKSPVHTENGPHIDKNVRTWAFLIALLTLLVYLPSTQNGFVNWDDATYVLGNGRIRTFDIGFLRWVFTSHIANNWHPLTIISYAIDYQLLGLNPFIYHFTNVVFHALNTFLVAILSFKLVSRAGIYNNDDPTSIRDGALKASLITSLLFGLHPLHVESVAWVSERKDVLYAFFYLLSVLSYLKYISAVPKKAIYPYYTAALSFFLLSLMSKPMAVSLPLILLLLDYYPFGRLNRFGGLKWTEAKVILEKIPFFILSALAGMLTIWAQGKAVAPLAQMPFLMRIFIAIRAYIFYVYKTILPVNLAPLYPYPTLVVFFTHEYMAASILFLLITVLSILAFRKYRFFLVLWLYYIFTLLPAIGLVQVGDQAAADRYTYLAGLGPFILVSGVIVSALKKTRERKVIYALLNSVVILMFLTMSLLTVRQENIWKDSVSLWSHEIALYPATYRAYELRGLAYQGSNDNKSAVKDFDAAIALAPKDAPSYSNRGISYGILGDYAAAIRDFDSAIGLNSKSEEAYNNRGYTYLKMREYDKAIEDFRKALELDPGNAGVCYNLGFAYSKAGDAGRSEFYFKKASRLSGKPLMNHRNDVSAF